LSLAELQQLSYHNLQIPVYGCQIMMTSAQCVHKTVGRCGSQTPFIRITDRMGKSFLSYNNCEECYSVLYEEEPLHLLAHLDDLATLGAYQPMLSFTNESVSQCQTVIDLFAEAYGGGLRDARTANVHLHGNTGHWYAPID
jgi:putative protease